MAPPPPPPLPTGSVGPCPGLTTAPSPANQLLCAPCSDPLDPIGGVFGDTRTGRLCGYLNDGSGNVAPRPLPLGYRGFDDPQADPDATRNYLFQTVYIKYVRADLYSDTPGGPWPDFGPYKFGDDATLNPEPSTGNPPWGSQSNDGDADSVDDGGSPVANRHNQGMYAAYRDFDRYDQQAVYDATAGANGGSGQFGGSCGVATAPGACNPYIQDCGGFAHFNAFTPVGAGSALAPAGPPGYVPYQPGTEPPSPADWPMVPFARDYPPYAGADSDPIPAIKRLLRFTSSIVSYDSTRGHMQNDGTGGEYRLEEDPRSVLVTADGTPIHGSLFDAYNYFINTVFADKTDPAINCRKYIIVLVTDGLEACQAADSTNPCGARAGHPGGPSGDLGTVDLTQYASVPPGAGGGRETAHAADPSIPLTGIPVYVVGMGVNTADPRLDCIATNSGGQVFAANNRNQLKTALESILQLKRTASSFSAPAVPALAGGLSDAAQVGAVVPSHLNPDGSSSVWSIWSGSLKAFKLDSNGSLPVVTAGAPTATPSPAPGTPTSTPPAQTPTPTATPLGGTQFFPDETNPNAPKDYDLSGPTPADRRPIWNASRVLGYTDPNTNLSGGASPSGISPAAHDPNGAIQVWPGRRMIWADNPGVNVPMTRQDFMPNSGSCTGAGTVGSCFDNLMNLMGTTLSGPPPTSDGTRQAEAILTVDFLRGGMAGPPPARVPPIPATHDRDQILNILPHGGGIIGPNSGDLQKFSYFYQDDAAAPGEPPQVRTDGQSDPKGYPHKLGDIFHSEPLLVGPPKYFQYLFADLTPPGSATPQPYGKFAGLHAKRRRVVFVGANDGFLHAFDAGVWDRDHAASPPDPTHPFANTFDLGTGREIFAYAPRGVMNRKFPNLIKFPPTPQYFVDGSSGSADVFIDPAFTLASGPNPSDRVWRSVLVGSLRQGGNWYYALDITQPDDIDTDPVSPTYGQIGTADVDKSPKCLDGAGASCVAGSVANRKYPEPLWEFTDDPILSPSTSLGIPYIGETWSRPVIGRIQIIKAGAYEDRYVAVFGGGYDNTFKPGDTVLTADVVGPPARKATRGRSIYMVDVETGKVLYKGSSGKDDGGNTVLFAPMPAAPALVDSNDDGYLDAVYIGDVNGRMWRLDLTPGALSDPNAAAKLNAGTGLLENYSPFLLYDPTTSATAPIQPVFLEPGLIYVSGGARPLIGVAWGTGDRANLAQPNTSVKRFHYVIDDGSSAKTYHEGNLTDISPPAVGPFSPSGGCAAAPCSGLRLDFAGINEKATSTVFSTNGFLTLVTFTPDATNPCTTEGNSYRYSYFFLTGQGRYGTSASYTDFRQVIGGGLASVTQSTTTLGDTHDTAVGSNMQWYDTVTPGTRRTNKTNWKEQ
jgi:Tfp pilus tip-associated adhesin PilY1